MPKALFSFCNLKIILLSILLLILNTSRIYAAEWHKSPNNPVYNESNLYWDDIHVHNPSVIKLNNNYLMWYDGNGGSGWEIGYASSSNGYDNWVRTQNPVINRFSDSSEISDPSVVINSLSNFTMFYSHLNILNIKKANSIDSLNWINKSNISFLPPLGSWTYGGVIRGRSTILLNNIYHMWFTARSTSNSWNIGYATSNDGISWLSQNVGEPINIIGESLNINISYPAVIFQNNLFHMWYGVGVSDMPSQIAYAYSSDGINWIKPTDNNPSLVLGDLNEFDQINIMPNTVILDNSELKMWYSGYGNSGHWRIGYATASSDLIFPFPTFSSTPTPTLTPTSTPTPTPPPTRQVIVVPGLGASWNSEAILLCKLDNYSEDWTLASWAESTYLPVMQALTNAGWNTKIYVYDWRKRIPQNEERFKDFINDLVSTNEKVNVVGHSMGGLIGRNYLEIEEGAHKLDKLLTVGSPHQGSIVAYPSWSAGKVDFKDPNIKFIATTLIKICSSKTKFDDRLAVHIYFPSANNLLPIFNYLVDKKTNSPIALSSMNAQNNWLSPTPSIPNYYNAIVGTLRGSQQPTALNYKVDPANPHDESLGNWIDGKPIITTYSDEGDGTVLSSSAQLPSADNSRVLPTDHIGLMTSIEGLNNILNFLGTPPDQISEATININSPPTATSGLYVAGYPGNFWILDPDKKIIKDKNGLLAFLNPKSGIYKLLYLPSANETVFVVSQILPNNKIIWKDYKLRGWIPKTFTINFDQASPLEDPLQ